MEFMCIPRV